MNQNDFDQFGEMLESLAELYGKTVKPTQTAMYFRVLATYPLAAIQAAMDAHSRDAERGRFWPLPADLIAQLEAMQAHDGRPTPEEAWVTALSAHDDNATVCWTTETAQAWGEIGKPLMDIGDKFNASRGFIDLYTRLVATARKCGQPVCWTITGGYDKAQRQQVIKQAFREKRISREYAVTLLPTLPLEREGALAEIQGQAVHRLENKSAVAVVLERSEELRRAGEAHQRTIERIAEARRAAGIEEKPPVDRSNCKRDSLAIFESAEQAGVFISDKERKEWCAKAANGESMRELQIRMLQKLAELARSDVEGAA